MEETELDKAVSLMKDEKSIPDAIEIFGSLGIYI